MISRFEKSQMQALARHHESGVGLIEVLIALIVISVGVLGMAGLQLTGLKHSTDGFNRAKATLLTENMATRMRINSSGVAAGLYGKFDSSKVNCEVKPDPYCQAYKDNKADSCDITQLAQFDLFSVACGEWTSSGAKGGVLDALPSQAKLTVNCNDSPCTEQSSYTLLATWPEDNVQAGDDTDVTDSDAGTDDDADENAGEEQRMRSVQMRLRP